MTTVGFTGTRKGMTPHQRRQLRLLLQDGVESFYHGDAIGADSEAHDIALSLGIHVTLFPAICDEDRCQRAHRTGAWRILDPKPPLVRNHKIVDSCDVLVAAPDGPTERWRSGTWATVRYARKRQKTVIILDREEPTNAW